MTNIPPTNPVLPLRTRTGSPPLPDILESQGLSLLGESEKIHRGKMSTRLTLNPFSLPTEKV